MPDTVYRRAVHLSSRGGQKDESLRQRLALGSVLMARQQLAEALSTAQRPNLVAGTPRAPRRCPEYIVGHSTGVRNGVGNGAKVGNGVKASPRKRFDG